MHGEHAGKFGIIYGALGILAIAAVAAFAIILTLPKPDVHKADVHKVAVQAQLAAREAAGEQNLVALCEANLTQQVNQAYGKVKGYSNPKVTYKGNKATVKVKLTADIYTGVVACSFDKSNWQLSNVAPQ